VYVRVGDVVPAIDRSVKVVMDPRHAVSAVKLAVGSGLTTTFLKMELSQLFALLEVRVTEYVPAVAKVCEGCWRVDVLLVPEEGSPKFHKYPVIAPPPFCWLRFVNVMGWPAQSTEENSKFATGAGTRVTSLEIV